MAVNLFDTRTMMGMITEGEKETKSFFRDRYFKNRPTFDTAKIDFDIVGLKDRKLAPFVHPKVGGVAIDRTGYRTESYEAPAISLLRVTTAEDMLKRSPGETIYNGKTPQARAAEILGKDLSDLDDLITRREEVMCREALLEGKVTVKGDGYDEVIDYWPSADKPTTALATKWTASTADATAIMADLRTIRRAMVKKAGFVPNEIICGSSVIDCLVSKLAAANALDNRRVDLGQINPQTLPNGLTYWGYLKDSALDIYSYDDWFVNDDGNEVPMMPEDKILMASPNARTTLAYGIVPLVVGEKGDNAVAFAEGARVPNSWVQRAAPAGRVVQLNSRPLPIINQVYGFHVITGAV